MSKPLRILVTGSRFWAQKDAIRQALAVAPGGSTVVHGDCVGADKIAGEVAQELGLNEEPHPADWDRHGPKIAGPIRNSEMVATGVDVCLAFSHSPYEGGTGDCTRKARAAEVPVYIHPVPHDWPKGLEQQPTQPRLPGIG